MEINIQVHCSLISPLADPHGSIRAGPTVVNRRECSIGAALLCVACGVGDLSQCVRRYHVDAFKTWPYLLGDEMYNAKHLVELDNTLELVYILKAYCGVKVHFSGASREDTDDAAFDIVLEKSDDKNCPILMLRERDVIIEIKNEWAKVLRKKLAAGHGKAEVESDGDDTDPGEEEKSKGRPVRADKVDVTISFQASSSQNVKNGSKTPFGPGRSEEAAVMRHKRQELVDESRVTDASLSLEEAMRRAAEEMWKTPSYRYRGVVCAAAHLYDDDPEPSYFDVNPDLEQDLKTAITDAFNTEIARNDKAMGGKHDGEARHAIKKLDTAELPNLQEAKSKLVAAFDKANGNVVTPHGAPWAGLVAAIDAEAADALETKVAELVKQLPPDRVVDLAVARLPDASDARVHQLKGEVDTEETKRAAASPAAPAPEAAPPAAALPAPAPMDAEPVAAPAAAPVPRPAAAAAARPAAAKPAAKKKKRIAPIFDAPSQKKKK